MSIPLLARQSYANAVLATEPVAYWRLGEPSGTVAAAEVGPAGTYVNAPTLGVAGALADASNTAVAFDGVNDHVLVADAPVLRLATTWTIGAWIKTITAGKRILSKRAAAATHWEMYTSAVSPGKAEVRITDGVTAATPASGATVADGAWHHVVFVRDGANGTFLIDGAAEPPIALGVTGSTSNTDPLGIGTYGNAGGDFFNGTMSAPALWNRALSAAEIATLNTAGRGY